MKDLWKILFGVVIAFLGAGLINLVSAPPRGHPVMLTPPNSPAPLMVHVSGAVIHPGVYTLPPQSRIWDAVQSAGGFAPGADQDALNLAAFIEDGNQIVVPVHQRAAPTEFNPTASPPTTDLGPAASPTAGTPQPTPYPRLHFPVDINSASSEDLESLPQIGQVRAARIIAYRSSHGPFKRIEDIRNVYDITPEVYAAIRDLIIASPPSLTPSPSAPPNPL